MHCVGVGFAVFVGVIIRIFFRTVGHVFHARHGMARHVHAWHALGRALLAPRDAGQEEQRNEDDDLAAHEKPPHVQ